MSKSTAKTRTMIYAALCLALGVVLPLAFHSIPNAGSVFLPMHIPVLLCGLICGPLYGLACGILSPLLSSIITGMPPAAYLPSMLCELAVYGLAAGVMIRVLHSTHELKRIYLALVAAMLCGRIVGGVLNALIFQFGNYSFAAWFAAYFVTGLAGILIQIFLIPLLIFALRKAGLIKILGTAEPTVASETRI